MPDAYSDPMRSGAPTGSPAGYTDPKTIDALLKSSAPEAVASAGRSYQAFAAAYEKLAGELLAMRTDLHEAWSGTDAAAAQSALREIWSASATIQSTAQKFGVALERHGSESLAWYKYSKPPSKNLADARSWMTGANERISQSWSSLPEEIATTLPPGGGIIEHGPASSSSVPTGGVRSASPGPRSGSGSSRGGSHAGSSSRHRPDVSNGMTPGRGGNGGTELAGLKAPPSATAGSPQSGGIPGSNTGPTRLMPSRPPVPGQGLADRAGEMERPDRVRGDPDHECDGSEALPRTGQCAQSRVRRVRQVAEGAGRALPRGLRPAGNIGLAPDERRGRTKVRGAGRGRHRDRGPRHRGRRHRHRRRPAPLAWRGRTPELRGSVPRLTGRAAVTCGDQASPRAATRSGSRLDQLQQVRLEGLPAYAGLLREEIRYLLRNVPGLQSDGHTCI